MIQGPKIAAASAEELARVQRIIADLRDRDLAEIDQIFQRIAARLADVTLSVSVVGQVKAGKSSLINALAGIGDLLPTNVNPWTAVITNLHFGYPGHGDGSAVFKLFGEEEWQRMLEGGSESRRLAEELLPGFKSEVLTRQIHEMQQTARNRLGDLYHYLLGKEHRFNAITPETLAKYVSAGIGDDDARLTNTGRFSCLTKSADIYLDRGPFAIPTTLADTPGINDPFLVRDEITTSSFRNVDIFVVALSAHQVLNTAELALLKLLSFHSGRIIVYVNRIDEIDEPAETVPGLIAGLKERLEGELGISKPTIIAGSAHWGRIAAQGTDQDVAAITASGSFADYASHTGIPVEASRRLRLLAAAGMTTLAEAISTTAHDGKIRSVISDGISEALSAIDLLGNVLRERRSRSATGPFDSSDIEQLAAEEQERIEHRIDVLNALHRDLGELRELGRRRLQENCDLVSRTVFNTAENAMNAFIDTQVAAFQAGVGSGEQVETWSVETGGIEEHVQQQVYHSFKVGRLEMDGVLTGFADDLNDAISPVIGELPIERLTDGLPNEDLFPNFRAKSNLLDVEMTASRGWKFWKSRSLDPDEAARRIGQVIRAELYPAICNLEQTILESIGERNGAATQRLTALVDSAQQMVAASIIALEDDAIALTNESGGETAARIHKKRQTRLEELEKRIANLTSARAELADMMPDSDDVTEPVVGKTLVGV